MKAVGMEKTSFYRKVKEFEQRAAAEIRENIDES